MQAASIVAGGAASAPANIPTQVGELFTQARFDAIERAGVEIIALAQATLAAHKPGSGVDCPDVVLDSALNRIVLLGSCVSVLSECCIDAEEIGVQHRLVFGRGLGVRHE